MTPAGRGAERSADMDRRMRARAALATGYALAVAFAVAALGALAPNASAIVARTEAGTVSYQPLASAAPRARPFDVALSNVDYNGGPVMPANTNYAVYWAPATLPSGAHAYPAGYAEGLDQFFEDLAHDSGGHGNVDSVTAQYNDASGAFAAYESRFGGAVVDEHPYPANGCKEAAVCLTDKQLRAELQRLIAERGLPHDLAHEYYLLTPPGVESCFRTAAECSAASKKPEYCAYHGSISLAGGPIVYADDPYVTKVAGCDEGNHPTGKPSDGALDGGLVHEHDESLTDPEPNNAWTDYATGWETGYEIGDKCEWEYGTPLGTALDGASYNQMVNGHLYWYQAEWSNQGHRCLQRLTPSGTVARAEFTAAAGSGDEVFFDASAASATGGVRHYSWQFNDAGHEASEETLETTKPVVSHRFPSAGSYTVALTVYAEDGTSSGTAHAVAAGDENPAAAFSASGEARAGQPVSFDASASADPDGGLEAYAWSFGDDGSGTGQHGTHTFAAAGTYQVKLTVTDSAGLTAAVTRSVTVAPAAEGGGSGTPEGGGSGSGSGGGTGGSGGSGGSGSPGAGSTATTSSSLVTGVGPGLQAHAQTQLKPVGSVLGESAKNVVVRLLATRLSTNARGYAFALLSCAGARCAGTLQLGVRDWHRHARRWVSIGTGAFALAPGRSARVAIRLNRAGRVLVRGRAQPWAWLEISRGVAAAAHAHPLRVRLLAGRRGA